VLGMEVRYLGTVSNTLTVSTGSCDKRAAREQAAKPLPCFLVAATLLRQPLRR
jgi:hypothetical protein